MTGLALAIFLYVVVRASTMGFTTDESVTYIHHARAEWDDLVHYRVGFAPSNNHLLNSLLMKAAGLTLGESPLALRLPNVVAGAVYLVTAGLWAKRLPGIWPLPGFAVLTLNPSVLDWFSLGRGYGLGLAFVLVSLFLADRALRAPRLELAGWWGASAAALIATLSTIPFLNFWLALTATVGGVALWRLQQRQIRVLRLVWLALPVVITGATYWYFMGANLLRLRESGELYYGGKSDFWTDTVGSLIRGSLPRDSVPNWTAQAFQIGLVILIGLGLLTLAARRGRAPSLLLVTSITLLTTVGVILQFMLFQTPYLMGRTAVFFLPLLGLIGIAAVIEADGGTPRAIPSRVLLVIWAVAAAWHMSRSLDFQRPRYVSYDADTPAVLNDLRQEFDGTNPVTLKVSWPLLPAVEFYRLTQHLDWLAPVTNLTDPGTAEYFYLMPNESPPGQSQALQVLRSYPVSRNTLARQG